MKSSDKVDRQSTILPITKTTPTTQLSGPKTPVSDGDGNRRPDVASCFLLQVMVPRASSTREIAALETAMQGLAPDARHPIALELVATATSRQFLLRATTPFALTHLEEQMQARYPQATLQSFAAENDPLRRRDDEAVSVVELRAGAAAYLPLRTWRDRELLQEGADPLLGLLATFNHLPPQMRVVAHLALLPALPTWSHPYRRKAMEHPLEPERLRMRREMSGQTNGPGPLQLIGMGVLVALLLLWWRFQRQLAALIPPWVLQAGIALLHGKTPHLTAAQLSIVTATGSGVLVSLFCLALVVLQIKSRFGQTALYDMRMVSEKTARPAYRVRLRLFVFEVIVRQTSLHPETPAAVTGWGGWSWSTHRIFAAFSSRFRCVSAGSWSASNAFRKRTIVHQDSSLFA